MDIEAHQMVAQCVSRRLKQPKKVFKMKTTQHVLNWFLDRGVFIKPSCIVWHWENGKMWFIVSQPDEVDPRVRTDLMAV